MPRLCFEVQESVVTPRTSWICRNEEERTRVVAMHQLVSPAARRVAAVAALLLLPCVPTLPPVTILVLAASIGVVIVIGQSLSRWERPELVLAYSVAIVEVGLAAAIVLAHAQRQGALILLLWPLMSFNARYPSRVAVVGSVFTALLVVVTAVAAGPSAVLHHPLSLTIPLAVVVAVATVTSAARASDIEHMRRAVVDPLTGLLNRSALASRVGELVQQATRTDLGVAVLIGDIDHFKTVNDDHGHQLGDRVLQAVAERLRGELRVFDLLYRIGGEEFAVLAPGATLEDGRLLAERLRAAVAAAPIEDLPLTISWGVSASPAGRFDWEELYHAADVALYEAKASGRNRVSTTDPLPAVAA